MSTIIDKYEIREELSSTSRSQDFLGEISGIQGFRRPVVLTKYHGLSPIEVITLAKDTNIMGTLNHANVLQVIDLGKWDDDWTVVTEQVRGVPLTEFIQWQFSQSGNIPSDLIAYILHEIIRGLEYAHRQHPPSLASHILHRNIHPDNILLGFQGNIKIKGFSTKVQIPMDSEFCPPDTLCDARTDVWGLGALLHTMLVGLEASDPLATQTSAPSSALERLTQQAVHPNPDRRFQSVAAFKEALLDQYGEIRLDGSIHMQEVLAEMQGEPFAVLGDDATFISRTVIADDFNPETNHKTLKQKVTPELLVRPSPGPAVSALEPITPIPTKSKPNANVPIMLLLMLVGLVLGFILRGTPFVLGDTAEIHWIFPDNTYVEMNGVRIETSGQKTIVLSNKEIQATWVLNESDKRELKVQLHAGESRWVNLEQP